MIKEHPWPEDARHRVAVTLGGSALSSGQEGRAAKGHCPQWRIAFKYSETVKDTKRIKSHRETDSQESRDMNKTHASYLFVAALSFLAVIALLFFAATDSKSTLVFSIGAGFFALTGAIWVYCFAKGRRAR
jgi:hypothetical protein